MGSYIYTVVSQQRDEIIDEKYLLLGELIYLYNMFMIKFKDNPNLEDAIESIFFNYTELLFEVDREHDLYDAIMDYFASLEFITDFNNAIDTNNLINALNNVSNISEARLLYYSFFSSHYFEILETGILTNNNRFYPKYDVALTKEEKETMLSLIPKVK